MKSHRRSTQKKIFAVYLLLIVVSGSLFFLRHHFFVRSLPMYHEFVDGSHAQKDFPVLTTQQSVNLGWAHTQSTAPTNSYIYFSKDKPEGTIRIGIFGDSFVQGVEAEQGFDFPSFLQRKYKNNGFDNIEVLNFGVHSYGMHQAFLLWKYVGKFYGLDYTIFMPLQFHRERDRSFVFLYNHFAPVHARYILLDEKLQLLPVVGETRAEAGRVYNSIISPWNYVRYDDKPPAFLRALLPMSRTLTVNPLYYRISDPDKEILTTYTLLFRELAHYDTKSIVICNSKITCDMESDITSQAPIFLKSQVPKLIASSRFLYIAPRTHLSALGNQLRGDELFSFLVKNEKQELEVINVNPLSSPSFVSSQGIPLYESQSVGVEMQGYRVASFMSHRTGEPRWTYDEDLDFRKDKIASLLRIVGDRNLRIVPVAFLLSDQEPVFLLFELDNVFVRVQVGIVHASSSYVGSIELFGREGGECLSTGKSNGRVCFGQPDWTHVKFETQETIGNVKLVIGETHNTILQGQKKGVREQSAQLVKQWLGKNTKRTVRLTPIISKFAMLRAKKGQFINITDVKEKEGTLNLVTVSNTDDVFRYPMVRYKIRQVKSIQEQDAVQRSLHEELGS